MQTLEEIKAIRAQARETLRKADQLELRLRQKRKPRGPDTHKRKTPVYGKDQTVLELSFNYGMKPRLIADHTGLTEYTVTKYVNRESQRRAQLGNATA